MNTAQLTTKKRRKTKNNLFYPDKFLVFRCLCYPFILIHCLFSGSLNKVLAKIKAALYRLFEYKTWRRMRDSNPRYKF